MSKAEIHSFSGIQSGNCTGIFHFEIPKGFCPPAQGCRPAATLGQPSEIITNLNEVVSPPRELPQPVPGCSHWLNASPKAARSSQPWAMGRNPVGIRRGHFALPVISGKLSVENLDIEFPSGMAEQLNTGAITTAHG